MSTALLSRRKAIMVQSGKKSNPNLIGSVTQYTPTDYKFARCLLAVKPNANDKVTFQLKLTEPLTSTRNRVDMFFDGSHYFYYKKVDTGKDLIVVTFDWKVYGNGNLIDLFGYPQNVGVGITVDWAKLEFGEEPTPFDGYAE